MRQRAPDGASCLPPGPARECRSCGCSIQNLRDVNVFHGYTGALSASLLMHHAGAVGRDDVFRAGLRLVTNFVMAHLRRDPLLEDREGSTEAAAFIGARQLHHLDSAHLVQEVQRFGEGIGPALRHARMSEATQRVAVVVVGHTMRELRPGECLDLKYIVKKLHQVESAPPYLANRVGLRDRIEIVSNVMHATARGRDDIVVVLKVLDEQTFRRRRFRMASAVRHRLAAAGLIEGIFDLDAEALQQVESRDADVRMKGVDIAGGEKPDLHGSLLSKLAILFAGIVALLLPLKTL